MTQDTGAIDRIRVPRRVDPPLRQISRRVALAAGLVVFIAVVVLIGRDGYVDVAGDRLSALDALYYASVTVTTTGYGDITAVSDGARLATILLITPARIVFLILVVGTTVEVLTDESRRLIRTRRWRRSVRDHHVICGYGETGQAAVAELLDRGVERSELVVVDRDVDRIAEAISDGLVAVHGDATQRAVLDQAGIADAATVVVVPNRDDTAVLVTLTVREINESARIIAAGRERENLHLLRQGGADEVIDATAAIGRMLGLASTAPGAVSVLDDLLDGGVGLELVEVLPEERDGALVLPSACTPVVVIRDGNRLRPQEVDLSDLRPEDRVVVLRDSTA